MLARTRTKKTQPFCWQCLYTSLAKHTTNQPSSIATTRTAASGTSHGDCCRVGWSAVVSYCLDSLDQSRSLSLSRLVWTLPLLLVLLWDVNVTPLPHEEIQSFTFTIMATTQPNNNYSYHNHKNPMASSLPFPYSPRRNIIFGTHPSSSSSFVSSWKEPALQFQQQPQHAGQEPPPRRRQVYHSHSWNPLSSNDKPPCNAPPPAAAAPPEWSVVVPPPPVVVLDHNQNHHPKSWTNHHHNHNNNKNVTPPPPTTTTPFDGWLELSCSLSSSSLCSVTCDSSSVGTHPSVSSSSCYYDDHACPVHHHHPKKKTVRWNEAGNQWHEAPDHDKNDNHNHNSPFLMWYRAKDYERFTKEYYDQAVVRALQQQPQQLYWLEDEARIRLSHVFRQCSNRRHSRNHHQQHNSPTAHTDTSSSDNEEKDDTSTSTEDLALLYYDWKNDSDHSSNNNNDNDDEPETLVGLEDVWLTASCRLQGRVRSNAWHRFVVERLPELESTTATTTVVSGVRTRQSASSTKQEQQNTSSPRHSGRRRRRTNRRQSLHEASQTLCLPAQRFAHAIAQGLALALDWQDEQEEEAVQQQQEQEQEHEQQQDDDEPHS